MHSLATAGGGARIAQTSLSKEPSMTRIALIIAILGLAACETVQGVGRDITNAGAAIDRSL